MKPPAQASWLFSHTLKRKQWKQRNRRIVSYLLGLFCRTLNSARKPYFGRKQQIGGILALYFSTMAMWKNVLKRIIIQMACYCRSLRFRTEFSHLRRLLFRSTSQHSLRFVFLKAFFWLVHNSLAEKRAKKVVDTWMLFTLLRFGRTSWGHSIF